MVDGDGGANGPGLQTSSGLEPLLLLLPPGPPLMSFNAVSPEWDHDGAGDVDG